MAREWYSRPINSGFTVVDGVTTGNYNNHTPTTYCPTWMEYKVEQSAADILANRSHIYVYVYSQVIDGGASSGMSSYNGVAYNGGFVDVDGMRTNYSVSSYNFNNHALNTFVNGVDFYVNHNSDGTKTIQLQAGFSTRSSVISGGSASVSVTLPTIARETTITSVTGTSYGSPTTIVLDRKASNLRELVTLSNGGTTLTLKTTASADTTFTYTLDRSHTPNTAKPSPSTWTLSVTTYNGSTQVGSPKTAQYTWMIGDAEPYRPVLASSPVAQAYNDVVSALGTDTALAGYSKINVRAAKADVTCKYGATIASRVVTFGNGSSASADSTDHISSVAESAGEMTWKYIVTDSRGYQTVEQGTFPVINYNAPYFASIEVYRGDSSGNVSDNGTYIYATAVGAYDSLNNHNSILMTAQVESETPVTLTSGTRTTLKSNADPTVGYSVVVTITDIVSSASQFFYIQSADVPFALRDGGHGMGIGAYADNTSGGAGVCVMGYNLRRQGTVNGSVFTLLIEPNGITIKDSGGTVKTLISATELIVNGQRIV